ncbi:MAG: dihydroorotase [Burkholderiales bacterium]|nr:dihydroorotase [Burkholderiales bacterium]
MDRITITMPDDWHLHVRDGDALRTVVPHTAAQFARAIIMPNLKPPIVNTELAQAYRSRIVAALPAGSTFQPLMTLYLTDSTLVSEIQRAKSSGIVFALKYYPAGATTNSDSGVTDIHKCFDVLEAMSEVGLPLLIHGEVTDPAVDIFDREKIFIERELVELVERFPRLKIVLEHITTTHAVDFVLNAPANVAATITAHHLLLNRNAIFEGGIRPHHYCLPVLKREEHRRALVMAATSGNPKFFLGTDSAPHERSTKENDCGCAGVYTAHAAMAFYTEAFEAVGSLDKLEGFACHHGADFYCLPKNTKAMTLEKLQTSVPVCFEYGKGTLIPLRAGGTVAWRVSRSAH